MTISLLHLNIRARVHSFSNLSLEFALGVSKKYHLIFFLSCSLLSIDAQPVDTTHYRNLFDSLRQACRIDFDRVTTLCYKICNDLPENHNYCFSAQSWRRECALYWNELEAAEQSLNEMEKIFRNQEHPAVDSNYMKLARLKFLVRLGRFEDMEEIIYSIKDTITPEANLAQVIRAKYLYLAQISELREQWKASTLYIQKCLDYEKQRSERYDIEPILSPNEGSLGLAYIKLHRAKDAVPLLNNAIRYYKSKLKEDPTVISYLLTYQRGLMKAYSQLDRYEKVDSIFHECLNYHQLDSTYIGLTYLAKSESQVKRFEMEQGLNLGLLALRKTLEKDLRTQAIILIHLGGIYETLHNDDKALHCYRQAVQITTNGSPLATHIINGEELLSIEAFTAQSRIIRLLLKSDPTHSLRMIGESLALIEGISASTLILQDQIKILEQTYNLYEWACQVSYETKLLPPDSIFKIFSRSRSHILQRELMRGQTMKSTSAEQREIEVLKYKIGILKRVALQDKNHKVTLANKNKLFDYQDQLNRLLLKIPPNQNPIDLLTFQQTIPKSMINIAFLWGDSALYACKISRDDFTFHKIEKMNILKALIVNIQQKVLLRADLNNQVDSVQELLHDILTFPTNIEFIGILADGPLTYFPFDILPNLQEKSISMATTFKELGKSRRSDVERISLMAPFSTGVQLVASRSNPRSPLSFSAFEIEQIARLLAGPTFYDQVCTQEVYRDLIKKSDILHLATHAETNIEEPELSKIMMSNGEPIHAFEVQSQKNNGRNGCAQRLRNRHGQAN